MNTDGRQQFYDELGERVQRARRKRGLTQERLATLIGLTRTSVVNLEKGRQKILCHTLVHLAKALQVSAEELLPDAACRTELDDLLKTEPLKAQEYVRFVIESSNKSKR